MRQPLWAINGSLLFFCALGQLVFFFLQTPMPRRVNLEPDTVSVVEKKVNATVDILKIYGADDLFGTYMPAAPVKPKAIEPEIPPIPESPALIPLVIPVQAAKVFIAPLPVTLKGVMYAHDRSSQSVAIIQFQDSKEEINYHVGQLINDAQILKIYPNRVIVVRSNGQQETLYLREDDAGKDLALDTLKEISALSIPFKDGAYQIPVQNFVSRVKTLGKFIDLLDLTTVYKKGKSIGCRVGKAEKDTLGAKLGFLYDDIIQQVDGLPVTDIASRVLVFDHTSSKKIGDKITVQVQRAGKQVSLQYVLAQSQDGKVVPMASAKTPQAKAQPVIDEQQLYNLEEQRQRMLDHKVKLAPTAHQLEIEERRKMLEARHRQLIAQKHDQPSFGLKPQMGSVTVMPGKQGLMSGNVTGAKG